MNTAMRNLARLVLCGHVLTQSLTLAAVCRPGHLL